MPGTRKSVRKTLLSRDSSVKSSLYRRLSATKPVLLIHGTRDTQVKLDQSKKFYKALRATNKQAKYIEIKNGTNYLDEEKNRKRVFKAMDKFLNQHL